LIIKRLFSQPFILAKGFVMSQFLFAVDNLLADNECVVPEMIRGIELELPLGSKTMLILVELEEGAVKLIGIIM